MCVLHSMHMARVYCLNCGCFVPYYSNNFARKINVSLNLNQLEGKVMAKELDVFVSAHAQALLDLPGPANNLTSLSYFMTPC